MDHMEFDFDQQIDRRGTGSEKWDKYAGRDVIPMWVADMDFASPPALLTALHERIEHGVLGYSHATSELKNTIVEHCRRHYDWSIDSEWIIWLPGLVPGLHASCRAFTKPDEEVLTFTPIYPPFLSAPRLSNRPLLTIPLNRKNGRYVIDLERFQNNITGKSRLLLFCNPHNPVGRVYSQKEIQSLAEVCIENNIIICSDEIHCDLILNGQRHIPTASINNDIARQTITLMSAAKTFNTAGMHCGYAVIPDPQLRQRFIKTRSGIISEPDVLGFVATHAAYQDGEPWRQALIAYLQHNHELLYEMVNHEIPNLSMDTVEGTYLAWIRTADLDVPDATRFFEDAGVGVITGKRYGDGDYIRLNFGCPRTRLQEALTRMKRAVIAFSH
jgi:cystathionine beta-lyase